MTAHDIPSDDEEIGDRLEELTTTWQKRYLPEEPSDALSIFVL